MENFYAERDAAHLYGHGNKTAKDKTDKFPKPFSERRCPGLKDKQFVDDKGETDRRGNRKEIADSVINAQRAFQNRKQSKIH